MAATNPFKTHDLIKRFGWTIMPYLSNLGVRNLAEAQVLFVDSGHTNALDADDTEHGLSFEKPLATVDYAIGLCTASEGAVILVAPGHVEDYDDTTTGFDADVAGIAIIGLGVGSLRPRFDFDNAASECIINANDVQIKNVVFRPGAPDVLIGLDFETGATGVVLEDVEFAIGEDGAGADEFKKAIHLTSGNHDCKFINVKILAHASAGGATHGIHIAAASDRLTFQNVIIDGPYSNGIVETAAGVNHVVEDCAVDTAGTNYGFHNSSTFAKRTNNVDGQVTEDESESLLLTTRGTGDYPTGITDESILAYILGKGATASAGSYVNTTDSLEAISDKVSAIDNTVNLNTAVVAAPVAKSMMDILNEDRAGSNTYDSSTDSLEAISNLLRTGTVVLAGINLDHLCLTTTGIAADGELDGHIVAGTILGHIMAANADPSDYNASTDSLEAISVALETGTGVQTVLETNNLDHLVKVTTAVDADGDLSGHVITKSVLAHIMSVDADVTTGYNASTDSLAAIAAMLTSGTTALSGINLNHLMLTAVVDKQNMSAELSDDTVLAHILTKTDGSITDFDPTTDSLEAIRDYIEAGTGVTTALAADNLDHLMKTAVADEQAMAEIVDGSALAHILVKGAAGATTDFDPTTDSLQALSDKTGAFSGDGGAAQDDSAKASLDILHTGVGTEFWVKKTLVSSAVITAGVDVSGVSATGELAIVDVVCKCDATGLATGTNFELLTDNAKGLLNFYVETVANLGGAVKTVDLTNASITNVRTVVEVGKKVIAKSTGVSCDGVGEIDVYIKYQRLTAGATIAAA